jgi:UDP-N-acetyl-D-mannosaminuronate dehydrogenase
MLRSMLDEIPDRGDVGILGLAYKPGAAIADESPGGWWAQVLRSRGRVVKTHDPIIAHSHSLEEVLSCPTIIVGCSCPEYKDITVPTTTLVLDPTGEANVSRFTLSQEVAS